MITVVGVYATLLLPPATGAQEDAPKSALPDGPGRSATERVCNSCHGPTKILRKRASRQRWTDIVDEMIRRGAEGTDEEYAEIIDYLAKNFPESSTAAAPQIP